MSEEGIDAVAEELSVPTRQKSSRTAAAEGSLKTRGMVESAISEDDGTDDDLPLRKRRGRSRGPRSCPLQVLNWHPENRLLWVLNQERQSLKSTPCKKLKIARISSFGRWGGVP